MGRGTKCLSRLCQCDQGENGLAENVAELRIPIRRLAGILRKDRRGVAACNPADYSDLRIVQAEDGTATPKLPETLCKTL